MNKFSLVFLLTTFSLFAQNEVKTCEILSQIHTLIQKEHLNPKAVDDSLSVYVFDGFIDYLDPLRVIFLKSEYDLLSQKYRLNIDNAINTHNCHFITDIVSIYRNDLLRNQATLEKIDVNPIDYDFKDTVRFYKKIFPIYLLENSVEKVLKKKIRYEILEEIASTTKNVDSINFLFTKMERQTKNKIIENEICKINTLLQSDTALTQAFYNLFCSYFDPHTAFFSTDSKSTFLASLSKEHLSLGLNMMLNENNEIIIYDVDPNGPAFRTGKIQKGDQIIAVSNFNESVQVSCATLESIATLIQSENNAKILLTLRRNSGKNFEVLVEKQTIRDEGNTVYSFVVEQNKNKYGYIKIPSFYGDIEGDSGKGCAEDTALEIIKLQKDAVKGIVIDLVDNGGGSMEEAIKLAGMFIDAGPISIVIDNKLTNNIIYAPYKGMLYKAPIVILVNSNSASASEFFTAIMQDYKRGLVLGSRTVGKATMQSIFPLSTINNENFIKVTINKFYSITGKSHQGVGITPDVLLPELYENIIPKEDSFPTAFKNDSITTFTKPNPYLKEKQFNEIVKNCQNRIAINPYFTQLKQLNQKIALSLKQTRLAVPITITNVFDEQLAVNKVWDEINSLQNAVNNFKIYNSTINSYLLSLYPNQKNSNNLQLDNLKKNPYLNEAISILEEFNSYKKYAN
ncbi:MULTISPECIES: S41 family peptidase [unclassified Flavobacterium]|uniref:S41 family peptidase n=1 Tax=unclassified Flavobacterium TaxID=196869 RepID=UPI003F8E6A21